MLKLLLYSLFCITSCMAHGLSKIKDGDPKIAEIACISLGTCCSAAINLERCNISKAYYPFDFITTPFDGLCTILESNFKDFISESALAVTDCSIKNKITTCTFSHDFDATISNYKFVAEKYQRRIDRFYQTIKQAKHIYFFRTHIVKEEALILYALLKKLFPAISFSLIVPTAPTVNILPNHTAQPWGIPGIKEFPLFIKENDDSVTHGRTEDWDLIFHELNLF